MKGRLVADAMHSLQRAEDEQLYSSFEEGSFLGDPLSHLLQCGEMVTGGEVDLTLPQSTFARSHPWGDLL